MDDKKIHEQSLALARQLIEKDPSLRDWVVGKFPELAESEDERIRKELIDQLQYIIPEEGEYDEEDLILPNYHERINRYKAYLEKQKEQKLSLCDKCEKKPTCLDTKYGDDRAVEQCINFVEKEQKPTIWTEEDEKNLCELLAYGETRLGLRHWIAGLSEKIKGLQQKPAEEIKDQRQIYFMIEDGRRCGVIEGRKQVIDNPEKYGLQKPAEWSEEDEVYLQDALWCVKQAEKSCKDGNDKGACWSAERWLKSLRTFWKPSEINPEEIRLLDTTISFLKDFADKGYENAFECIDWLKSKRNGTARK